jgi:two-component system sensor histidine kinase MtrB
MLQISFSTGMKTLDSIYYSVATLGLITTLTTGIALDVITTEMHKQLLATQENYEQSYLSQRLIFEIGQSNRYDLLWAFTRNRAFLNDRDYLRNDANRLFYELQSDEKNPRDQALLDNATQAAQNLFSIQNATDAKPATRPSPSYLKHRSLMSDKAYAPLRTYIESKRAKAAESTKKSKAAENLSNWIARPAEAIGLLFFIGLIWLLRVAIHRPLKKLFSAMEAFRQGKTGARIDINEPIFSEAISASSSFNQLADSIKQLESRKMEYLVGIAHDIRNPLTAIKTAASILVKQKNRLTEEKCQDLLNIIAEQIDRLDLLVNDWMDIERVAQGKLEMKLQPTDVRELAKEAIRLWTNASRGHWFSLLAPNEPVLVQSDPRRLTQVLNNLVSNAIKYSPNGGAIDISILSDESFVSLSVADHGIGISEEDIPHIFEPFKRSIAVRELIPGIGLGLSTSKKIVETLGGTIEVESKLNVGSVFKLKFPHQASVKRAA